MKYRVLGNRWIFFCSAKKTDLTHLEQVLSRTFVNSDRVIDVRFPTQTLRFLRLAFNLIAQVYMLSEIEVYGEGFAPETSYRTAVIDLGAPVNFGRIFWEFEKFRKTPDEARTYSGPGRAD